MQSEVLAEIAIGSVIVAVSLILLIAAIMVAAIIRYADVDSVLKVWGALGTVLGLVLGTMGTYFFTRDQVEQKDTQLRTTQAALRTTENEKAALGSKVEQLAQQVKGFGGANPNQAHVGSMLEEIGRTMQTRTFMQNAAPKMATPSPSPSG